MWAEEKVHTRPGKDKSPMGRKKKGYLALVLSPFIYLCDSGGPVALPPAWGKA